MKKNKKGLAPATLISLVLAIAVFPSALYAGAHILGYFSNENPAHTASIRSFESLADEIQRLIDQPGAFNSREHIPFSLSDEFAVIAFGTHDEEIQAFGLQLKRPYSCPREISCLCLTHFTVRSFLDGTFRSDPTSQIQTDVDNSRCITYSDRDIIFRGVSENFFLTSSLHSDLTNNGVVVSRFSRNLGGLHHSSDFLNLMNDDFTLPNYIDWYNTEFLAYVGLVGGNFKYIIERPGYPSQVIQSDQFSRTVYVDTLTLSPLDEESTVEVFVTYDPIFFVSSRDYFPGGSPRVQFPRDYISYYNLLLNSADYDLKVIQPQGRRNEFHFTVSNVLADIRMQALDHLRYRDAGIVSGYIINSNAPELILSYFFDYLMWVNNDLLHKPDERDDVVLELTRPALERVLSVLQSHRDYCVTLSENRDRCLQDRFIPECSVGVYDVRSEDRCKELHDTYVGVFSVPSLLTNLTRWIAMKDGGNVELSAMMHDVHTLELDGKYDEAFRRFFDYVQRRPSFNASMDRFPSDLRHFREALRIYDYSRFGATPSVIDEPLKEYLRDEYVHSFVQFSDDIQYIFIPGTNITERYVSGNTVYDSVHEVHARSSSLINNLGTSTEDYDAVCPGERSPGFIVFDGRKMDYNLSNVDITQYICFYEDEIAWSVDRFNYQRLDEVSASITALNSLFIDSLTDKSDYYKTLQMQLIVNEMGVPDEETSSS